jgi:hypothetical protein
MRPDSISSPKVGFTFKDPRPTADRFALVGQVLSFPSASFRYNRNAVSSV